MSAAWQFWEEEIRTFPLLGAGRGSSLWVARLDGEGERAGLRLVFQHAWGAAAAGRGQTSARVPATPPVTLAAPPLGRLLRAIETGRLAEYPARLTRAGSDLVAQAETQASRVMARVEGAALPVPTPAAPEQGGERPLAVRTRAPCAVSEPPQPVLRVEPLRRGEEVRGAFALTFDAAPPWGEAVRFWLSRFAARIGPLLDHLPVWPPHLMGTNGALGRQPALFVWEPRVGEGEAGGDAIRAAPVGSRAEPHPPRGGASAAPGLPLPRPVCIPGVPGAVGVSAELRACCELALAAASASVSVLLHGESGTGKEILARAIHLSSPRRDGPFIGQNCAALPETLFESELFGHKAGAFTGAAGEKAGLLEAASGGTFFLDEIGDMPLPLQIKLLRVMQERRVRRIGELESHPVDIRWIAATHKDLASEIATGRFRLDLYYRLKVVRLVIPPLRRRPEDIPHLVAYFLRRHGGELTPRWIEEPALAALQAYRWPGNVRELENEVCRLLALHTSESLLRLEHLSPEVQASAGRSVDPADLATLRPLEEAGALLERYLIRKAIEACAGRKASAARRLGLSRQGLYKKIRRYGMLDLLTGADAGDLTEIEGGSEGGEEAGAGVAAGEEPAVTGTAGSPHGAVT